MRQQFMWKKVRNMNKYEPNELSHKFMLDSFKKEKKQKKHQVTSIGWINDTRVT